MTSSIHFFAQLALDAHISAVKYICFSIARSYNAGVAGMPTSLPSISGVCERQRSLYIQTEGIPCLSGYENWCACANLCHVYLFQLGLRRLVSICRHRSHQCFVFTFNRIFTAICHFFCSLNALDSFCSLVLGLMYARIELAQNYSALTAPLTKCEHDLLGEFSYKCKKHLEAKK